MAKWPKMISTKDIAYISDMFNWNMTMQKKLEYYLEDCNDEELSNLLEDTLEIVENNTTKLEKILESGENNGM